MENTKVLNIKELSELVNIPISSIRMMLAEKNGPAYILIGRRKYFTPAAIKKWLNQ